MNIKHIQYIKSLFEQEIFFIGSKFQENTAVEKSVSMNTTVNESIASFWSCSALINPEAEKIGATVAYSLCLVFALVGNFLLVLIVYKTPILRKPIDLLIANMAMSDLLYPTFLFPVQLAEIHVGSWFIGGTFSQALCKLHIFLADASSFVSIQSLVLIAVDRFGAVVVPLRSRLITRKLFHSLLSLRGSPQWPFFRHFLLLIKLLNTENN